MSIFEYNEEETMKLLKQDYREEGREEGRTSLLYELVQSGDISVECAAKKLDVTVEEIQREMKKLGYS